MAAILRPFERHLVRDPESGRRFSEKITHKKLDRDDDATENDPALDTLPQPCSGRFPPAVRSWRPACRCRRGGHCPSSRCNAARGSRPSAAGAGRAGAVADSKAGIAAAALGAATMIVSAGGGSTPAAA